VLVLSCPASDETRNLIGKTVLERLGPSGYLINVSRGSVVDEPALLDALEKRTIAGAGMDVFASEPNLDPRWLRLENVVLQPHSTSITHETRAAMIDRLTHDLDAYQNKQPFHNAAASSM
jgi:hydroxypyruvate reductase